MPCSPVYEGSAPNGQWVTTGFCSFNWINSTSPLGTMFGFSCSTQVRCKGTGHNCSAIYSPDSANCGDNHNLPYERYARLGYYTGEATTTTWYPGLTSSEAWQAGLIPRAQACCFRHADDEDTAGCRLSTSSLCQKGYDVIPSPPGCFTYDWLNNHFNERLICKERRPFSNFGWRLEDSPQPRFSPDVTKPWPSNVACRSSGTADRPLPQDWIDAGYDTVLRHTDDGRTWEEACEIGPLDGGFQCQTIGFPLAIDADGFAVFDAGLRRTDPGANACVHTLGDLYVDDGGVSHSIACVTTTTGADVLQVAVGDLHHSECVAMYQDYRWDDAFEC